MFSTYMPFYLGTKLTHIDKQTLREETERQDSCKPPVGPWVSQAQTVCKKHHVRTVLGNKTIGCTQNRRQAVSGHGVQDQLRSVFSMRWTLSTGGLLHEYWHSRSLGFLTRASLARIFSCAGRAVEELQIECTSKPSTTWGSNTALL